MADTSFWTVGFRQRLAIIICGIVLGAVALSLFTQHRQLPYHWHPDEYSKIKQIRDGGSQNFRHPKLMIELARISKLFSGAQTRQELVEAGRFSVALSAAVSIVLLAMFGWECARWYGFVLTGTFVMLVPPLYGATSSFKEDPVLLMGLSAWLLCATWYVKHQNKYTAIALGFATAIACSGKHVGAVSVALSIYLVLLYSRNAWHQRRQHLAIVLGSAVALYSLINIRIILTPSRLLYDLFFEFKHVTTSHHGFITNNVWLTYLDHFVVELGWPLVIIALFVAVWRVANFKHIQLYQFLPLIIACVWFVMLCFGKFAIIRYALPAMVMLVAFTGAQLGILLQTKNELYQRLIIIVATIIIAVPMGQGLLEYDRRDREDSRFALKTFVDSLPADARIRADSYTGLNKYDKTGRINVDKYFALINGETPHDLLKAGFTHLAISSGNYDRYINRPYVGKRVALNNKRKAAYIYVLEHGEPIWSHVKGSEEFGYTLHVYDLASFPETPEASSE